MRRGRRSARFHYCARPSASGSVQRRVYEAQSFRLCAASSGGQLAARGRLVGGPGPSNRGWLGPTGRGSTGQCHWLQRRLHMRGSPPDCWGAPMPCNRHVETGQKGVSGKEVDWFSGLWTMVAGPTHYERRPSSHVTVMLKPAKSECLEKRQIGLVLCGQW